jgi:hypothetical protein
MRRKRAKHRAHRLTKEVEFFSICTNDSFPDTLDVDRTYETVAGLSCIALPLPLIREWSERPTSHRPGQYLRRDTMGGERPYTTTSRLACAKSFPSDTTASCRYERRLPPPRVPRRWPRLPCLLPRAERPFRNQHRSPCSPPRVSRASREIVRNNKHLGAACSEPL